MVDTISKEQRSATMAKVHSKNTKPEILVRSFLFRKGYRFRICQNNLPGHPDIVLKKYKSVIFVHGCFWHGHDGCKNARIPKSNVDFWTNKIERNKKRFDDVKKQLELKGWKVLVVWECELKTREREKTFHKIINFLNTQCV
nr:MAG TPA: DNA G:T-mismatch repair endonuclease [Caudoviricetes sp.]